MVAIQQIRGFYLNTFLVFVFFVVLFSLSGSFSSRTVRSRISQHSFEAFKPSPSHNDTPEYTEYRLDPPEMKPANATLDFQEIFYISLEDRPDRRDAMSLIAAATGIKIKWFPAVDAKKFPAKGYPEDMPEGMKGKGGFGCWRSHANVWKHIIDNDITSALVLEDDADWDMNIRQIMGRWNWQMKYNNTMRWGNDVEKGWDEECSYGCDWDELFVGQCFNSPNPDRLDLHQIYFDPDTPLISENDGVAQGEIRNTWNVTDDASHLRIIAPTWGPVCTLGYAVSNMGAKRMLYNIGGFKPLKDNVDLEFIAKTQQGKLSGYTMVPAPFNMMRKHNAKDSDIDPTWADQDVKKTDEAEGFMGGGLANSARKGLEGWLDKNYWKDMEAKPRS